MKILCDKQKLYDVISNVSRAVSAKTTLPALEGILLRARDNTLFLSGYDLDLGISASMEAKVTEPGEIVLTAKLFVDMVRRMAGETVSIESNEKYLTVIKSGFSEFTILGIPADEFPEFPTLNQVTPISLPQSVLKSMIDQTLFAIATNDAKPVQTGSLFEVGERELRVISVDGFRLAMRREPVASEEEFHFIVPGKTLSELTKLLGDEDEKTEIQVGNKHIIFKIGGYSILSRLLEGDFLDYNAAIPSGGVTTVTVGVRPFIDSIERTSLLISDRLKSPLKVVFGENQIKMSCSTAIGKAYDELECQLEGTDLTMGFNNRYLLDALRASGCDQVKLVINGPLSPMKMTPMQGESFLFLVLPVRLKAD